MHESTSHPSHRRKVPLQHMEEDQIHELKIRSKKAATDLQSLRRKMYTKVQSIIETCSDTVPTKFAERIQNAEAYAHEVSSLRRGLKDEWRQVMMIATRIHELRDQIFEQNFNLVLSALKEHQKIARHLQYDEQLDAGEEALLKVAEKWDPAKGELSTYLYTVVKNELMMRLAKKEKPMKSLDDVRGADEYTLLDEYADEATQSPSSNIHSGEMNAKIVELVNGIEHEAVRRVIELRFGIGRGHAMHWKEIVEALDAEKIRTPKKGVKISKEKVKSYFHQGLRAIRIMARKNGGIEK